MNAEKPAAARIAELLVEVGFAPDRAVRVVAVALGRRGKYDYQLPQQAETMTHRPYRALDDDDFEGAVLELAEAVALDRRPRNSHGHAGRPGHPGPGLDIDAGGYRTIALRELEAIR